MWIIDELTLEAARPLRLSGYMPAIEDGRAWRHDGVELANHVDLIEWDDDPLHMDAVGDHAAWRSLSA